MRTSIVSIISALVIAATTGTAMAATHEGGESAAMAQTYVHNTQTLDTSSAPRQAAAHVLATSFNGQSAAMAQSLASSSQPLERTAYSNVAQANVHHGHSAGSFAGRTGHSVAMADALASTNQPLHDGFAQANDQVAVN